MPRARFVSRARFFLLFSVACLLASARLSSAFPLLATPTTAVEYRNSITNHYFITANNEEMSNIEAGSAGPGWVRTGYGFRVYSYPLLAGTACSGNCGEPVKRFYGASPNSHFYTVNPDEAAILERPGTGWVLEGIAFSTPRVGTNGSCGDLTPVFRLYNNRFSFNDSNHRFVTSASERARMISLGWLDEGIAFCSYGAAEVAVKSYSFAVALNDGKIQPSAVCEDESRNLGPCMAMNNLAPPTRRLFAMIPAGEAGNFQRYTGLLATETFIYDGLSTPVAATTAFVQQNGSYEFGMHVDTIQRGPAVYTSINPLYQFRTGIDATGDNRVFPFSSSLGFDAQISVRFMMGLKKIELRNDVSHAYGHPTLEFIDQKSGRHVYFTALTYGTVLANDYLAPDTTTGKVIVGTAMRAGSSYIRNIGNDYIPAARSFQSPSGASEVYPYEFHMNRDEFRRVLASARTIYPDLSPEPEDYMLDNYHFNNEVYGDGEIGVNLASFRLDLIPRQ